MKKIAKRDKILRYVYSRPEATTKEVATKAGTTYGYAYKIMNSDAGRAQLAKAEREKAERAKTRATKEAKTAEFHAKKEQRITRADILTELLPGINALFGEADKFKKISDGSTASYYEVPADAKELQDLISHKDMNAQIGEIFRSCYRYGEVAHSKKLRDAKKIKYYAEAEIKRLEKLGEG